MVDAGGVALDSAAVVLPIVPGGAGAALKAYRAADVAMNAGQAAASGIDATIAVSQGEYTDAAWAAAGAGLQGAHAGVRAGQGLPQRSDLPAIAPASDPPQVSLDQMIYTRYQEFVDAGYQAALKAESAGELTASAGQSRNLVLGQATDDYARTRLREFLAQSGISEGPTDNVLVNRRLVDPSGSGNYRIPDVRIDSAGVILEGTMNKRGLATNRVNDLQNFSSGGRVTVVVPRQVGGSYSMLSTGRSR